MPRCVIRLASDAPQSGVCGRKPAAGCSRCGVANMCTAHTKRPVSSAQRVSPPAQVDLKHPRTPGRHARTMPHRRARSLRRFHRGFHPAALPFTSSRPCPAGDQPAVVRGRRNEVGRASDDCRQAQERSRFGVAREGRVPCLGRANLTPPGRHSRLCAC